MAINRKEITSEQIMKAAQCKTADELMALAKGAGFDITQAEAEAYMAELADVELDGEQLKNAAGGGCYSECQSEEGCPWLCSADVRASR